MELIFDGKNWLLRGGSETGRPRRRIHHKLAANHPMWGEISCFLCGRCDATCPTGIDMIAVIRRMVARYATLETDLAGRLPFARHSKPDTDSRFIAGTFIVKVTSGHLTLGSRNLGGGGRANSLNSPGEHQRDACQLVVAIQNCHTVCNGRDGHEKPLIVTTVLPAPFYLHSDSQWLRQIFNRNDIHQLGIIFSKGVCRLQLYHYRLPHGFAVKRSLNREKNRVVPSMKVTERLFAIVNHVPVGIDKGICEGDD